MAKSSFCYHLPFELTLSGYYELAGHNTHFLLSTVIKHLDHKNVLKNPNMQIDIVQVAICLARVAKAQSSVKIVGAFSDMMRHLRKSIHCSLDDSELGEEIIQWNRKFHTVIDECLVQLSYKVIYLSSTSYSKYQQYGDNKLLL